VVQIRELIPADLPALAGLLEAPPDASTAALTIDAVSVTHRRTPGATLVAWSGESLIAAVVCHVEQGRPSLRLVHQPGLPASVGRLLVQRSLAKLRARGGPTCHMEGEAIMATLTPSRWTGTEAGGESLASLLEAAMAELDETRSSMESEGEPAAVRRSDAAGIDTAEAA